MILCAGKKVTEHLCFTVPEETYCWYYGMVPRKMVHGHLTPLLMLRNAKQEVSLYGKQTTTKAATIVDNFLIKEEVIPKIYLPTWT